MQMNKKEKTGWRTSRITSRYLLSHCLRYIVRNSISLLLSISLISYWKSLIPSVMRRQCSLSRNVISYWICESLILTRNHFHRVLLFFNCDFYLCCNLWQTLIILYKKILVFYMRSIIRGMFIDTTFTLNFYQQNIRKSYERNWWKST